MATVGYFAFSTFLLAWYEPRSLHSAVPCGFYILLHQPSLHFLIIPQHLKKTQCRQWSGGGDLTLCHSISATFHKYIQFNASLVQTRKQAAHISALKADELFRVMCHLDFYHGCYTPLCFRLRLHHQLSSTVNWLFWVHQKQRRNMFKLIWVPSDSCSVLIHSLCYFEF